MKKKTAEDVKAEQIQRLTTELEKASSLIVGTFSKLAKDFELRKTVRTAGGRYQVVKNTLAKHASEGPKVADVLKGLKGVTSIGYTSGDPVALAKALSKYFEDNPEYAFKAGVLEGRVISMKEIKALATMPSKEEIYSYLLFLIKSPAQRLVAAMSAIGRVEDNPEFLLEAKEDLTLALAKTPVIRQVIDEEAVARKYVVGRYRMLMDRKYLQGLSLWTIWTSHSMTALSGICARYLKGASSLRWLISSAEATLPA
jgi:large subunit ribosomal protein L10